jgi:phage terminase large subunit
MILPDLETTTVFSRNRRAFEEGYKIIVNQGGTSSSKTYSILQLLIVLAASPIYTAGTISVVSESIPHLKRGAIRDFQKILGDKFDDAEFNRTDHIYKFNKSQIEFFSADDSARLRGGRRNILFLNECNNITMDAFDELDVRTVGSTFLDYNPVSEFWIHELLQKNGISDFTKDCFPQDSKQICFIHSTYMQARQVLPKATIDKIESRRERNPNWWNVYGLGLVGNVEGLVHPIFTTCEEMPAIGSGPEFYGLDFGFTDETALIKCMVVGDQLYCDQLIYETGLTNPQIARRMESFGIRKNHDEIFADSAEPKSIKEIASYGFNIKGVEKGPDSVRAGILKVNEYRQVWTKRSVDSIKEQRNYRYIQKDDGTFSDKPMDDFDHSMSARRYAVISKHLQAIERMRCLVHDCSKYTKDEPLGGFYEVFNGFAVRENWATIVTCQWDKNSGQLHVNFEATMNTIEDIKSYCNSVKKAMNVAPPVLNPTNGAAVQNLISQLIAQKVPVVVDPTFDALGTLYFLNNIIDRRKFSMNSHAESLMLAIQNDTEVKNLSPHLEALLYIVNNIAIKVKDEETRKPLKMFSKEKLEYQKEQELALKVRLYNPDGTPKPVDNGYAPGW